jgi:hypothetical protein
MSAIRNCSRVRRVLAVASMSVCAFVGYADPPGGAEVVGKTAEDAQSAWSSASKGFTGARDRRELFNEMRPALKKGMSRAEVERLLGTANADSQCEGGHLWTYVLNHGCAAQLLFDKMTNLDQAVVIEYPYDQMVHGEGGEWKIEGEELPQAVEKESLAGMWRATMSLKWGWYRDKTEIAKRILGYLAEIQTNDVRRLLGEPANVSSVGEDSVWTYIVDGENAFLHVFVDQTGESRKVSLRTHDWRTGELNAFRTAGAVLSPEEAKCADVSAWQTTIPRYQMTSDRRGIGKKMETYIKAGMKKEEVEKMMGAPQRDYADRPEPACYYDLHTDSSIGIKFDAEGKVSSVRHIGT